MNNLEPFLPERRLEEAETLGDERGGIVDGAVPHDALRASEELRAKPKHFASDQEAILDSDEGWGKNELPRKGPRADWYLLLPLSALGIGFYFSRWLMAGRFPKHAYPRQRQALSAVTGGFPEDMNGL